MELESSSLLVSIISFFVFVFTLQKLIPNRNKPKPNLPPGPPKLPLIGHLHLFNGSDPPQYTLRDLAKKYGPLMHLKLGEVDNVVVTSPQTAQEFLKTHDVIFASRPSLIVSEIGCYGNTDLAFSPYGDYWRQMRKICTQELLSAPRVQSFRPIREEEVSDLCR
ncbi:cytochrome p450 71d10 [Phtheirospermum japonicum]|uniref:Cytochrome p450 71d10 n=1 Tax=Phtheirospermum japonicum TaxID=374723 RepID=A0A830CJ97_9LAMI|nr:cytochrome p450 71d10 [Phtheirospermum japonicum]